VFVSWIAFPAAMLAVCLGLGLLVDRLSGRSVAPVLLLSLGGGALVCVTQLMTAWPATAGATVWVAALLAASGLLVGRRRIAELKDIGYPAAAALAVFVVASMPVIATGTPSFAGYTVLGDTVVHLAGAEEMLDRGRDASGLPPSNYAVTYRTYYEDNAYPAGGATALGALARVVGADPAWVFQPFLGVLLALLALAVAGLVGPVLRSTRREATVAFVAAQPALLIGFAMQGSLKEIAATSMLATLAALIPAAAAADAPARTALPLGVMAGAAVGVLGPSAGVWAAPLVLGWLVLARAAGRSPRSQTAAMGVLVGAGAVGSLQTLLLFGTAASVATSVATAGEAGNLLRALDLDQAVGVWLTGDFRVAPTGAALVVTRLGEMLILGAAAFGVAWAVARRAWVPLLYTGTMVAGAIVVVLRGSLWADAKALAIVSPALLTLAMLGITGHLDRHRLLATGAAAGVVLGVLASNVLVYRSSSIAPQERLEELALIGRESADDGPALLAEFDEFAPYFLRDAQPEPAPLVIASPGDDADATRGAAADLDGMTIADLERFPVVITRRGPIGSRPSSVYELADRTPHYEVWRRETGAGTVLARGPLGDARDPVATASCARLRGVARAARDARGRLVVAERPAAIAANPARDDRPAGWRRDPDDPVLTLPSGGGSARTSFEVPAAGRYAVWLEASIGRATRVDVDGATVGTVRNRLAGRRVAENLGTVALTGGRHTVTLARVGGGLAPGDGGLFRPLGRVYFVPMGQSTVRSIPAGRWREVCDRPLDWVEAVA
jgi:hypothetical protein